MKQLNFDEFVKMLAGKLSNKEIVDKNLSYQPNLKINLKLKIGDVCSVCGHTVKERPLFYGKYVGCMC